jgi:hypothetical protein
VGDIPGIFSEVSASATVPFIPRRRQLKEEDVCLKMESKLFILSSSSSIEINLCRFSFLLDGAVDILLLFPLLYTLYIHSHRSVMIQKLVRFLFFSSVVVGSTFPLFRETFLVLLSAAALL